jgi:hypothetical protein
MAQIPVVLRKACLRAFNAISSSPTQDLGWLIPRCRCDGVASTTASGLFGFFFDLVRLFQNLNLAIDHNSTIFLLELASRPSIVT